MRLYGKRFMANRAEARISDRKESRDAVVYDISEARQYCRVQVAGSQTLVHARFPDDSRRAPSWLRKGAVVRVVHVGGDKSRIEVAGPGLVKPDQGWMPVPLESVNAILTGMFPTAPAFDSTGWIVNISPGMYRINGGGYQFNPGGALMDNGMPMGSDVLMGSGTSVHVIDPIAATEGLWFRYDGFFIGTDKVVDYLKGDEWEWEVGGMGPEKPQAPSNHVLIRNYILVSSGTTAISQANIGKVWEAPRADHLDVVCTYADPYYPPTGMFFRSVPGVVWGGAAIYEPSSPGGLARGAVAQDMLASATITVMTQYNTPYSYWSSGSINQLEFQFLGSALYGGYGDVTVDGGAIENPTDESGFGPVRTVSLGYGYQVPVSYTRKSSYIAQPSDSMPGYPGYYRGDVDSHTAIIMVRLVSDDARNPVSGILMFSNLDLVGNPM